VSSKQKVVSVQRTTEQKSKAVAKGKRKDASIEKEVKVSRKYRPKGGN